MWAQILSITSILLGLYLLYIFFITYQFHTDSSSAQYHMGCFSTDNHLNHSISIGDYLKAVNASTEHHFLSKNSFQLASPINYQDFSRAVARDFEIYLNEFYQVKSKDLYEDNFQRAIDKAQSSFNTCNSSATDNFDSALCNSDWKNFLQSKEKYLELKTILEQKIQRKEQQEKKISYLILDTNYSDADQYERNLTSQINSFNARLQEINARKIQLLALKSPIQIFITTNKTKLQQDEKLYDQCIKNMKIITFCNDLTRELNTIKLTFTKQDIQTKIQRKKFIIDSFKNAIRNAEKIGDTQMARISQQSLLKNQKELGLLIASIESFESFEESYCSKCSDQKVTQLKSQIQTLRISVQQLTTQHSKYTSEEEELGQESVKVSQRISQIEEERDFHINSNICVTPECQQERSKDIKDLGRVLNEMKKQVLDYKFIIEEHKISHSNTIGQMDKWTAKLSQIVDCFYSKQYLQALKSQQPKKGNDSRVQLDSLGKKLKLKLESMGNKDSRKTKQMQELE